jgi:hypothetical protein
VHEGPSEQDPGEPREMQADAPGAGRFVGWGDTWKGD